MSLKTWQFRDDLKIVFDIWNILRHYLSTNFFIIDYILLYYSLLQTLFLGYCGQYFCSTVLYIAYFKVDCVQYFCSTILYIVYLKNNAYSTIVLQYCTLFISRILRRVLLFYSSVHSLYQGYSLQCTVLLFYSTVQCT